MGRVKRTFERPENKRDAKLIVIAAEGRKTERIYFEGLAEDFQSTKTHIKVIEKLNNNSSPQEVLDQLNEFALEYKLDENDELWMVIDRDYQSWTPKMIKSVAQICHQKKGYFLALSNPAFELWLILHHIDVSIETIVERNRIFENKKNGSSKPYCKKKLSNILGGFNEANYDPKLFTPNVTTAIENSIKLDSNPRTRWPSTLGTRVYKLARNIIESVN